MKISLMADDTWKDPLIDVTVYEYQDSFYLKETIWASEITPGEVNTLTFAFELHEWVPALEVRGSSHGNADIQIFSVEVEEI